MNEIVKKENNIVENLIYEVRGKQVMLDSDLAKLYNCKNGTKVINQAVNRNIKRFPEDFYFQLTKEEFENLKSQIVTSSSNNYGGIRKLPFVFTEQGVAMLASVLKTDVAALISIQIMRAFVSMRHYLSSNFIEQKYINNIVLEDHSKILLIQNTLDKMSEKIKNNHLFYDGQIYDAYSLLLDIFNESKEEIIVIDNYANKKLLDLLCKTNKKIIIYSKNMDEELINKYQKQYNNIIVKNNTKFHDRFIIIDKSILYHCGSSFKDLGSKCFAINKIEDKEILDKILNYMKN